MKIFLAVLMDIYKVGLLGWRGGILKYQGAIEIYQNTVLF